MTEQFLTEHGFNKIGIAKNIDNTVFAKRIHEQIYLEFDISDGFFMLLRNPLHTKNTHKIIIPNKCKNPIQFMSMYHALTGEQL